MTVSRYEGEADYSAEIAATFVKFRQGDVKDYSSKFSELAGMNHIEAQILERVAQLFPDIFRKQHAFCQDYKEFRDPVIKRFDREV